MITRKRVYLTLRDDGPEASRALERDGYAVLPGALTPAEVEALRAEVTRVYEELPPDVRHDRPNPWEDFRYEMLNRSALCQQMVGDRRLLDVIEPLLGEDCHVIANTAWRNLPRDEYGHGGGFWHIDAGPHVPRPADVPWDDRIPYPIFAVGVHVMLQDCDERSGPTAVLRGSHRSGQSPPLERIKDADLTWNDEPPVVLNAKAGDILLFASDVWHRRMPTAADDPGRFFLQIHYGRRDLAQRIRPTEEINHLSKEATERAKSERERTVIGLHHPLFYDG